MQSQSTVRKPDQMSDISVILSALDRGESLAAEQLLPVVYEELRKLAAARLAQEPPGQTLQATALVHEVFIRLVDTKERQSWRGRGHFFSAAAEAMRRILVENARRRQQLKRGGDRNREELSRLEIIEAQDVDPADLIDLDWALNRLSVEDPEAARLVQLRYFAGLSVSEAAEILHISPRSADRLWAFARAWLHREISGRESTESGNFQK